MRYGPILPKAPHSRHVRPSHRSRAYQIEGLEPRLVLSAAPLGVVVDSATTADSETVQLSYDVNTPNLPPSLTFGIYRSADGVFDSSDTSLASVTIPTNTLGAGTPDLNGQPAAAQGNHSLKVAIPGGLNIIPDQPYVLVVANPSTALGATDAASRTASIHIHVVGVVTHGGLQYHHDDVTGPLWERQMATSLKNQGYDAVIPYVWAGQSRTPGHAAEQGPKLAKIINNVASQFPAGDPVDVHFIGHSEGAIVNSQADQDLQIKEAPQIAAGYIKMTMLDPHAATGHAPGGQLSVAKGFAGSIAKSTINWYQTFAKDPLAAVPPNVKDAEVFYQHTKIEFADTNGGLYNLWGQVPVRGTAKYYDLTGPGMSHTTVHTWYQDNVVPNLHDGGNFVNPDVLTSTRVLAAGEVQAKDVSTAHTSDPAWSGTAAPGATVSIFAVRRGSKGWERVGRTLADSSGNWTAGSRVLPNGVYRIGIRTSTAESASRPNMQVWHRTPVGGLVVNTPRRVARTGITG